MFGLFKKKSELDKLYDQHKKLLKEAHSLSTSNRMRSDLIAAEADELMKQIELLEDKELEQIKSENIDNSQFKPIHSSNIKQKLLTTRLTNFQIYYVNDSPTSLPNENIWLIDGGIELHFENNILTLAWNTNRDCFGFYEKPFQAIYNHDNALKLEPLKPFQTLIGKQVKSISFIEHDITYVMDYSMKTETEKSVVGIVITFEDGTPLQLAMVDYEPSDLNLNNFKYEIGSELLASIGKIVPIKLE